MLKRLTTKVYLIHLGFFNRHISFFVSALVLVSTSMFIVFFYNQISSWLADITRQTGIWWLLQAGRLQCWRTIPSRSSVLSPGSRPAPADGCSRPKVFRPVPRFPVACGGPFRGSFSPRCCSARVSSCTPQNWDPRSDVAAFCSLRRFWVRSYCRLQKDLCQAPLQCCLRRNPALMTELIFLPKSKNAESDCEVS